MGSNPDIVPTQRQGITDVPDPATAVAGMAAVGNPRIPMGMDAVRALVNASAADVRSGMVVPKKNAAAGSNLGPTGSRGQIMAEKLGARYAVLVNVPAPISHEAAPTMANARIVPSAVRRTGANFGAGAADADL
jgi:hypothetical protein